jgi:hypothetical protein
MLVALKEKSSACSTHKRGIKSLHKIMECKTKRSGHYNDTYMSHHSLALGNVIEIGIRNWIDNEVSDLIILYSFPD